MPKGQTPALKPETAARYRQVVNLKAAGLTFDEIADRVGYKSRSGAKEAYDAALRWWGNESVDQLRTVEGERLEQLWRRTFAKIVADPDMDSSELTALVNTAVRVSQRKSALFGMDSPERIEVEVGMSQVAAAARAKAAAIEATLTEPDDVDPPALAAAT